MKSLFSNISSHDITYMYDIVRLFSPCFHNYKVKGGNSSGIAVNGHDVLLIPHPPNAPPDPTNPTWGGRGGGEARRVGGVGWVIGGGGVLEEYPVHMHTCTYTHVGTRITVGKNWKFSNCS